MANHKSLYPSSSFLMADSVFDAEAHPMNERRGWDGLPVLCASKAMRAVFSVVRPMSLRLSINGDVVLNLPWVVCRSP